MRVLSFISILFFIFISLISGISLYADDSSLRGQNSDQSLKSQGLNIPIHKKEDEDDFDSGEYTKDKTVLTPQQAENLIIKNIVIIGNKRTEKYAVDFYITLKMGEKFSEAKLTESIKNLKNTTNFSKVYCIITKETENDITVTIVLHEKWTILPYIFAGGGGGSDYAGVGFYDSNIWGRTYVGYMAAGCKNGNCSQLISFVNPHLQARPLQFGLFGSHVNNTNYIYTSKGNSVGSYNYEQYLGNAYLEWVIEPSVLSLGPGLTFLNYRILNSDLDDISNSTPLRRHIGPLGSGHSLAAQFRITLGDIDYDGIQQEGLKLNLTIDSTGALHQGDKDYTLLNAMLTFMRYRLPWLGENRELPFNSYFASRLGITLTSAKYLNQQPAIGGLDKVRGFYDNEFYGKFAWFTNLEYRIPSYMNSFMAVQHVFFFDMGNTGYTWSDTLFNSTPFKSIGLGVRLLPLTINKVAVRIDYAFTTTPFENSNISFGLTQFF